MFCNFSSGKMKVDNSLGIVPDQIMGISTTLYSPTRKYVSFLYKISNANTSIAQFRDTSQDFLGRSSPDTLEGGEILNRDPLKFFPSW